VQVGQDYLDFVRDESLKNKITHVIVATPVYPMIEIVTNILKIYGNKTQILVEKPFTYDIEKLMKIQETAKNVFIALNRRCYSNIIKLKKLIKNEVVRTLHFDFSERTQLFGENLSNQKSLDYDNALRYQSIHLIDLAFFLMGIPDNIETKKKGKFTKSGNGLIVGYGTNQNGTYFTFNSDWKTPGNWQIHLTTDNLRVDIGPLEQVRIRDFSNENFKTKNINLESNRVEVDFKPGFYNQTQDFVYNGGKKLCGLSDYIETVKMINLMLL
jgi:predicted dehydrogenase